MQNLIYLDTNVFSLISENSTIKKNFIKWISDEKLNVIISVTTISELFAKEQKFELFNTLINNKINFIFLGSYSRISTLEIQKYPNNVNIMELSLNNIVDNILQGRKFDFSELKKSAKFVSSVQKQKSVANSNFRQIIEKWKQLFPPDLTAKYSKQEQSKLMKMIERNVKSDIKQKHKIDNISLDKFKTRMIINKALMKKYLFNIPRKFDPNDFADIMHIAYSPYTKYFITEKNNFDVLDQIKKETNLLNNTEVIKISDFKKEFK